MATFDSVHDAHDHTGVPGVPEELDYTQITSTVTVTATSEGAANTVVTAGAIAFDGSTTVDIEFFSCLVRPATDQSNGQIDVWLYDGSSSIGRLARIQVLGTGNMSVPVLARTRLTPSNASHTYSVRASISGGTSGAISAGAGGTGTSTPAFIRIVTVP